MKKVAIILLCLATATPLPAQWLHPESVSGALWGGLIGGIAGRDRCHGFSGSGAAIGAGVGLLAGTLVGESRRYDYYESPIYVHPASLNVSFGYGSGSCGSSAYIYYAPNRYCAPGTYYRATRPNYVVSGTVLGAASGALMGAAHHRAGNGAAIGAAAGLAVGTLVATGARPESLPAPPPAAVTSKPGLTSTYTWTARPQIPDAPRVPDAPTF